ncbi:hypothetical protein FRC11_002394, partial [Ceratobasidium sp. 423]
VKKLNLNTHPPPRGYLEERDLAAMFEVGFAMSEEYGRESFIQTQLALNIIFFAGLRSGSLAAGNPKFKEWRLASYIKLRDLTIYVASPGNWNVKLASLHCKGYNELSDPGCALEFFLEHVTKPQNLIFDVGFFLVILLFLRKAIVGINMPAELFMFAGKQFVLKTEMLDQPLFRARSAKGCDLLDEPASSAGITESAQALAGNLGIPFGNSQCIRRSIGSQWGIVWGAETARRLLGHAEGQTTFDRNYSKDAFNFDIVPFRLGELDQDLNASSRMALMRQRGECMVVDALINAHNDDEDDEEGGVGQKLTPVRKKAIKDPFIGMFDDKISENWKQVHSILPGRIAILYEHKNTSINHIRRNVENDPEYIQNEDEVEEIFANLKALGKLRTAHSRSVAKKLRHKKASVRRKEFDEKKADHTLAELADAEASLPEMSGALKPAAPSDDI